MGSPDSCKEEQNEEGSDMSPSMSDAEDDRVEYKDE